MRGSESVGRTSILAVLCAALAIAVPLPARSQVFIIQQEHISPHYTHFPPTHVALSSEPMTTIDREDLIRYLQSQQGFAMRPLPVGIVTLHANGGMDPWGNKYVDELHAKGTSAKPGGRVIITAIKFQRDRIVLDLNNGPFHKHRFLRHLSIGMGGYDSTNPVVMDDGPPTGSRIVLEFPSRIPDLTGEQAEALLKPMVDFGVKSPAEAYAETLPSFLRTAIVSHHVLVGMDRDLVLYAKGEPEQKIREQQNGQPFEIWVYGESPQPVEFVRFVGGFVTRVEVAKVGEPVLVRTAYEMHDYWGNQPAVQANVHQVDLGDRTAKSVAQQDAPAAPPTLRKPGEKLPGDQQTGTMKPVEFPPGMQRPGDPGYTPPPGSQTSPSGTATGTPPPAATPPSDAPQQFAPSSAQASQQR